jgi:DNA-directed RNA polymerase specialized sigma24 family protein
MLVALGNADVNNFVRANAISRQYTKYNTKGENHKIATGVSKQTFVNELPERATTATRISQQQNHWLTDEDIAQMVIDYTEHHLTVYQLTEKYDCNRTTVSKVLKSKGVNVTIKRMDDKQIEEAVRLYAMGLSLKQVGQQMGICESTIRVTLRKAGVEMRKPRRYSYVIHPPTAS